MSKGKSKILSLEAYRQKAYDLVEGVADHYNLGATALNPMSDFGSGAYEGASYSRGTRHWYTNGGKPDAQFRHESERLRDRSRDLYRNNVIGRGSLRTMVTNVIGRGLRLQSNIDYEYLGLSQDQAAALESTIQRRWKLFTKNCRLGSNKGFNQMLRLAYLTRLQSGEVFGILRGNQGKLKIQLIEPDQVETPLKETESTKLRNGIRFNDYDEPVAYFVTDPVSDKSVEIPAVGEKSGRRNILHLFQEERPGQSRGVPFLSPVLEKIKQLGDYQKSELTAAVVQSLFTIWIKSDNPSDEEDPYPANKPDTTDDEGDSESPEYDYTMGPGAINFLDENQSVDMSNPTRPNQAFEAFITAIMQEIGMALEIPYEILAKRFMASYSASRAARVEFRKFTNNERQEVAECFCQPIFEEWMTLEVLNGHIKAPGFLTDEDKRAAYLQAQWVGDSMGQIDEVKEVAAAQMRIQSRFSTHEEETAYLTGGDFESNVRKVKRENELLGFEPVPSGAVVSQEVLRETK